MMPFKTPVTLRQALAMAGLIGTVLLAAAIMVMVQGELVRHLRADLEADGRRIAERLARDSRLAVMLEVADNVQPSVDLALAFPNVAGVAVYTRERQPLVDRLTDAGHFAKAGPLADAERLTNRLPPLSATRPLEETETHLVLLSPVLVDSTPEAHRLPDSDLERAEGVNRPAESTELQGWVVVQMSKATLHGTVDSVLWNVLLLTLGVALVVYLALALFVGWITAPLQQLARVMTDPATVTRYTQAPVRGSQEARHMARAFNTLISAFAEVNRRLVALNAALDARVTERTRALEQANAELRRASEAKSMFLSRISHELRTPLQGVILSADLLTRSRRLENDQRRIVQTIDSSATLLLGLIDNVLDLACIEAGKLTLEPSPFDLHQVIHRVLLALTPQAQAKDLALSFYIDPELPHRLIGDPVRLGQVLINLLGNAIKFTPRGRVALRTWPEAVGDRQVSLHLEVVDTGIGIAEDDQVRLFQPFEQLGTTPHRHPGGTGLGTAIARHLVELMGGQIGVDSQVGRGSRFWIELTLPRQAFGPLPPLPAGLQVLVAVADETRLAELRPHLKALEVAWWEETEPARVLPAVEDSRRIPGTPRALTTLLVDAAMATRLEVRTSLNPQILGISLLRLGRPADAAERERLMEAGYTAILERPLTREVVYRALHATREMAYLETRSAPPPPQDGSSPIGSSPDRPLRILVAEDDPVNGALLEQILAAAGHEPQLVSDGEQALAAVIDEPFDLALLDRHMPLLDGDQVIARYHRQRPKGELRFILVSADATPATTAVARASGVERLLIKPITADALLATIAELAGGDPAVGETAHLSPPDPDPTPADLEFPGLDLADSQDYADSPDSAIARARQHIHSPAFVAQLHRIYADNVRRTLTRLDEASRSKDLPTLRGVVHELKGGALAVGEKDVVALCQAVETALDESPNTVPRNQLEPLRRRLWEISGPP